MSRAKAALDGLKDHEYENIALLDPPIQYVLKKDCIQEMVLSFKGQHLKMQIGEFMELRVSIWHSRMRKAFLMHLGYWLEAIKKNGYFKAHKDANEVYVAQCNLVKQAKAALAS
jgi:hypothetical protein